MCNIDGDAQRVGICRRRKVVEIIVVKGRRPEEVALIHIQQVVVMERVKARS